MEYASTSSLLTADTSKARVRAAMQPDKLPIKLVVLLNRSRESKR